MNVFKTKDHLLIKALAPKIKEYMEKEEYEQRFESVIRWLRNNLNNYYVSVWIATDDENNVLGYLLGNILNNLDSEYFNTLQLFGETEEIEKALLEEAIKWGKEYQLFDYRVSSKKQERWEKYGFKINEYQLKLKE